jgi:hypothetical protein
MYAILWQYWYPVTAVLTGTGTVGYEASYLCILNC